MKIERKLDCRIQRDFTFRMKIILIVWIIVSFVALSFPETINEKLPLLIFFVTIDMIIFIYRKIVIKKIKSKSKLIINEHKITIKVPTFKKAIYLSEIKMFGYRINKGNSGDLIINLTALKLDYLYLYNLIYNQTFVDETPSFKSFIVPDVEDVKEVYNFIIKEKCINLEKFEKIGETRNSELAIFNDMILTKNKNSEILYCDEKRFKILEYGNTLKILNKSSFFSKGGIIVQDYGLPSLNYTKKSN